MKGTKIMKKPVAAAAAITLLFFLSACGGDGEKKPVGKTTTTGVHDITEAQTGSETTEKNVSTQTKQSTTRTESKTVTNSAGKTEAKVKTGENLQKYVIDVIETGRYTMTVQVAAEGMKMDYTAVISGKNSMQELNMSGLMTIRLVRKDGGCYLISPKGKRYAEISTDEFEEQLEAIESYSMEFRSMSLTDTSKVTKNGKNYVVETYRDKEGKISKFYFRNNTLEMVELADGGNLQVRKFTISPKADESKIAVPSGYKKVDAPGEVLLGLVS
jgi:hypothetical protein